ncbi:taurine catabolism dioxygenase TauD [Kwoniella heveanensis BCC8398]|uniref:Taurine catabolism dioxygenase TauD n=1 Tax=Kwoniella heveanensis BCC8398 TaxID=1296120 RepID=A0A1B9GQN7_9TREE|nr:taurine catabolism dioxygenase TauD [Kwoniella heveanensis BCC8398]
MVNASSSSTGLQFSPIPLPPSANPTYFKDFGRKVEGFDPADIKDGQMDEIIDGLYKHSVLLFKGLKVTPEQQYFMTHAFDPEANTYGHGNNKTQNTKTSILHPDLKTIPRQPQVQLIGNGKVPGHYEGLESPQLRHPHHKTFHKNPVSPEDEAAGVTRFYRWHIDAALYNLSPPKVTSLYAVKVPQGPVQICRYDDGTGDELPVPLGGTVFASGKNMFDVLPENLRSLAVRTKVQYAPHPYVWMSKAHALPTGLGIENEGLELGLDELPEWEESKIKLYPVCWKNPVTSALHLQVHPCGAKELHIEPLPAGSSKDNALYPNGAHLTDLSEVRELLYKIQRPGIAPELLYPQDWEEGDLVLFHNRGLLHSVVGAFTEDQLRMFHQCNLAASDDPSGPDAKDVKQYA